MSAAIFSCVFAHQRIHCQINTTEPLEQNELGLSWCVSVCMRLESHTCPQRPWLARWHPKEEKVVLCGAKGGPGAILQETRTKVRPCDCHVTVVMITGIGQTTRELNCLVTVRVTFTLADPAPTDPTPTDPTSDTTRGCRAVSCSPSLHQSLSLWKKSTKCKSHG